MSVHYIKHTYKQPEITQQPVKSFFSKHACTANLFHAVFAYAELEALRLSSSQANGLRPTNKSYICSSSTPRVRLSATRSASYLTSPQARSLYPLIDLCRVMLLSPNKTALGLNDLGADRWASGSDLWAQARTSLAALRPCERAGEEPSV